MIELLPFLAEAALRWSLPLFFVFTAFALYRWLAKQSASEALRNLMCRALLIVLFGMPFVVLVPPPLPIPLVTLASQGRELLPVLQSAGPIKTSTIHSEPAASPMLRFSLSGLLTTVYIAVASALVLRFILGIVRLQSILAASCPFGLVTSGHRTPVEIRLSHDLRSPASLSFGRPIIFVPRDWAAWPAEEQAAVVTHELAHLRRQDGWWQWLATVAAALFWFHPGVWWLRRELLLTAEECCDRAVLDTAFDPHRYARLLLSLTTTKVPRPALAMAAWGTIERRIQSVLAPPSCCRPGVSRYLLITAAACLGITLYASAAVGHAPQHWRDPGYNPVILEAMLGRDRDNLFLHSRLVIIYWNLRDSPGYYRHLSWLVDHHPEVQEAGGGHYPRHYPRHAVVSEEAISKAWSQALVKEPQSSAIAVNAGRWFRDSDPQRAVALFRRTQAQPDLEGLSIQALCQKLHPGNPRLCRPNALPADLQNELTDEIARLHDPAQLSSLGTRLSQFQDPAMVDEGTRLLVRAIAMDPNNPRWREALDSALAEPVRQENLNRISAARHAVRPK